MDSRKIEGVSIERLRDKKKFEFSMTEFLKLVIGELPTADKVNDEIKDNNGQSFRISSLEVIEMDEDNDSLPFNDNENDNSNSSAF